jgi:Transposase DDE domain
VVPVFGYKNHVGIDREFGFLRRYTVTHAAAHDGGQLGAVLDRDNTASDVWADTAYRSAANLALLDRRGLRAQYQRKKPRGKKMPAHIARGNAARARVRSRIEHVFAAQKCRLGLLVRTVGMVHARVKNRPGQSRLQLHPAGLAQSASCAGVRRSSMSESREQQNRREAALVRPQVADFPDASLNLIQKPVFRAVQLPSRRARTADRIYGHRQLDDAFAKEWEQGRKQRRTGQRQRLGDAGSRVSRSRWLVPANWFTTTTGS